MHNPEKNVLPWPTPLSLSDWKPSIHSTFLWKDLWDLSTWVHITRPCSRQWPGVSQYFSRTMPEFCQASCHGICLTIRGWVDLVFPSGPGISQGPVSSALWSLGCCSAGVLGTLAHRLWWGLLWRSCPGKLWPSFGPNSYFHFGARGFSQCFHIWECHTGHSVPEVEFEHRFRCAWGGSVRVSWEGGLLQYWFSSLCPL